MPQPTDLQFGLAHHTKRGMRGRRMPAYIRHLAHYPRLHRHGQDSTVVLRNFPGSGPDEGIWALADGHGTGGEDWSYRYLLLLTDRFSRQWMNLKRHLRARHGDGIDTTRDLIRRMFREVETEVMESLGDYAVRGGTTATLTAVIVVRRKRYVIQAAVGDSPGGLYYPERNELVQTVVEANGDNRVAVQRYHRYQRERGFSTPPIIFGRINTAYCQLQDVEWPVGSGRCDPIPAWIYHHDRESTVTPNREGYEQIRRRGYFRGMQSRNLPPAEERPDGSWEVLSGYEADNWGNSCEGNGQNLTGAGDLMCGRRCPCEADVSIRVENGPVMAFAMSDGIGDLFPLQQTCQQVLGQYRQHGGVRLSDWQESVTSQLDMDSPYDRAYAFQGGYAAHDDCSFVATLLPAWTPPPRRRR